MKRLLTLILGVVISCVLAAPAFGYAHEQNTLNQCYSDTVNDYFQNFSWYDSPIIIQSWVRYSDRNVYVQIGYYYRVPGGFHRRRYDCHYVGDDSASGGLTNISFKYVMPLGSEWFAG